MTNFVKDAILHLAIPVAVGIIVAFIGAKTAGGFGAWSGFWAVVATAAAGWIMLQVRWPA